MRFATMVLAVALWTLPARAAPLYCDAVTDVCALVPRTSGGAVDVNVPGEPGFDPAKPWVVGGTSVLSLTPGDYAPPVAPIFGTSYVFVVEDATLSIKDNGMQEVGVAATILLCDRARFEVINARFRSNATFGYQYPVYSAGQSHVEYQNSTFASLAAGAQGDHALFQVVTQHSSLNADTMTFDDGNALELEVLHSAQATVNNMHALAETYVGGAATLNISNSFLFDVFFHTCPTDNYTFSNLPAACDPLAPISSPRYCFAAPLPLLSHTANGPPGSAFHLSVTNSLVFSWGLVTYPGSHVTMTNIVPQAAFTVGLGLPDSQTMLLQPGANPVSSGLNDRTLIFDNANLLYWHVWPTSGSHTVLLPGSSFGDIILTEQGSRVTANGSTLRGGHVTASAGTAVELTDCTIDEALYNTGGTLRLTRATFASPVGLTVGGPTYLADTDRPAVTFSNQGVLHEVRLTQPLDGAMLVPLSLDVMGTVVAVDANGPVLPFPPAHLTTTRAGGNAANVAVTSAVTGGAITTLDTQAWDGAYTVELMFDEAAPINGTAAISTRTVHATPATDGGVPTPSSSSGPVSSSVAVSSSGMAPSSLASTSAVGPSSLASIQGSSQITVGSSSAAQSATSGTADSTGEGGGTAKKGCQCAQPRGGRMAWLVLAGMLLGRSLAPRRRGNSQSFRQLLRG